ncbi:MAG: NAD(P)-binding domain-containing protein [Elusimicrobia bacterium]|nr:NAD(P)-binding domain-containing protein [Elusimicrobiota bacterium]
MDASVVLAMAACCLGIVLAGLWHARLERERSDRAKAALLEARERGTHRAVAQHPSVKSTLCLGCGSCAAACPAGNVLGLVNGTSHVIHGSKCIGYGKCEAACPVGAITVGLGDISARPDIPLLSDRLETSVPGLFIAGELGGIALIRHAIRQGVLAAETVAERLKKEGPGPAGVRDLVIVGAGPAGMAASLAARHAGLDFVTLSQDGVGGTVRKYPRRKLTLLQTVDLPLHGRLQEGVYEKEKLVELLDGLASKHGLSVRVGAALQAVTRGEGVLEVRTSLGVERCRGVVLALGRRGTPRRLGVPGEDLDKVLYQLVDASTYRDRRVLVVGGGDSAVEAATALANQPGNAVVLSYRKAAFSRLKERNLSRIGEFSASGRIRVLFNSAVTSVEPDAVVLRLKDAEERLPNDHVFVFAGGEVPFPLLKSMGVKFGGDEALVLGSSAAQDKPKDELLAPRLFTALGWAVAGCAALFAASAMDYYGLSEAERPLHSYHAFLRPSGLIGLALGVMGSILIGLNLTYLVRRGLARTEGLGSPRSWMSFHVFTGLLGPLFILLHSAFSLRSPLPAIAGLSLLAVVLTGLVGRYVYARTPRSVQGREMELAEIRRSLAAHRDELERLGLPFEDFAAAGAAAGPSSPGSTVAELLALVRVDFEASIEYRKLRDAVAASQRLRPMAGDILALGRRYIRERRWLERYHELRGLMSGWRFLHLWFALVMIVIAAFHILVGLRLSRLDVAHASITSAIP